MTTVMPKVVSNDRYYDSPVLVAPGFVREALALWDPSAGPERVRAGQRGPP
jgi:hypothetical protein